MNEKIYTLARILYKLNELHPTNFAISKEGETVTLNFNQSQSGSNYKGDFEILDGFFYNLNKSDIHDIKTICDFQEFNSVLVNYFADPKSERDFVKLDEMINAFDTDKEKDFFARIFAVDWFALAEDTIAMQPDLEGDLNAILRGDYTDHVSGQIVGQMLNKAFKETCAFIANNRTREI